MYTIIGPAEGPFIFRTHVAVSDLEPADASHILEGLGPFLERLRERASEQGMPSPSDREPSPVRAAAEV